MFTRIFVRLGLCSVLAAVFSFVLLSRAGGAPEKVKTEYYKGKVVPLAQILEKFGAKLDAEAAPHWLALVTHEHRTTS